MPSRLGISVYKEQFLLLCLGLAGTVVFLTPLRPQQDGNAAADRLDLGAAHAGVTVYIAWYYQWFLLNAAYQPPLMLVLGFVVILLVMEGLRRVTGWLLFIVVCFIAYGLLAHLVPAPLTGTRTDARAARASISPSTPMRCSASRWRSATTIVVIFIFMGQVLFKTGGGEFFTDIAMATMGRRRGGAGQDLRARLGLFGTISGSAISNVSTVGVVTIPLMKRSGYSARRCRRHRGHASTGGQFMPPIMGAAAFLMAEFLEIAYADVAVAAIIPALLYYFAIFVQVDLVAARDRIASSPTNCRAARACCAMAGTSSCHSSC